MYFLDFNYLIHFSSVIINVFQNDQDVYKIKVNVEMRGNKKYVKRL